MKLIGAVYEIADACRLHITNEGGSIDIDVVDKSEVIFSIKMLKDDLPTLVGALQAAADL